MFDRDYSFKGGHADKVKQLTSVFDDKGNKIFMRMIDVYLVAPIVGFLYGRKSDLDTSSPSTANILLDAMSKSVDDLWFNYRLIMLLDEKYEPDYESRINKAFREYNSEKAREDEALYESYVRGGVEILHEKLMSNVKTIADYPKNLYNFIEEFDQLFLKKDKEFDPVSYAKW